MCTSPLFRFASGSPDVLEPLIPRRRFKFNRLKHNYSAIVRRDEVQFIQERFPLLAERLQEIPCGRCIDCRLDYSRVWAERAILELKSHEKACFVTLTYDDDHLSWIDSIPLGIDYDSDKVSAFQVVSIPILVKKHLQDFMKRLRKKFGVGIRFMACGEYGDLNARPHYHLILFGVDFDDRIYYKSENGCTVYISPVLSNLWPFGFSTVGSVTFDSCAYVARYCMKKLKGKSATAYVDSCDVLGVDPVPGEFFLMSRDPGIGAFFYNSVCEDLPDDPSFVLPNGRKATHNRYSDSFLSEEDLSELKKARERARTERSEFESTRHSASEEAVLASQAIDAERRRRLLLKKL